MGVQIRSRKLTVSQMQLTRQTILSVVMAIYCGSALIAETRPMQIVIDATDLPRKLLRATVSIPLDDIERRDGKVALWYPKWVPGSHGPGGPIANVAGLLISDAEGNRLDWQRAVGEFHCVLVEVPERVKTLTVDVRYITDQPTTTSIGHDAFGSALVGIISPSCVLFYADGVDIDDTQIEATLQCPDSWVVSSALPAAETAGAKVRFQPVTLRSLVDSPIMCGRYRRIYDLVEAGEAIPPHRLHIFSEAESVLEIHPQMLNKLRAMVTQASRLFGSHPFDQFDILLATTDVLPKKWARALALVTQCVGATSIAGARETEGLGPVTRSPRVHPRVVWQVPPSGRHGDPGLSHGQGDRTVMGLRGAHAIPG